MSEQPDPAPEQPPGRQVVLRRAPRYRAFVVTGALIGVAVALGLYVLFPGGSGNFSARAVFGYVGAGLALLGGVLGGVVAVLVERPHR